MMNQIKRCLLLLLMTAPTLSASAVKSNSQDSVTRRLSIEFRHLYINGDEKDFYAKADELFSHLKQQPTFDHNHYYSLQIDVISYDMNNGHFYRAMRKAKSMVAEMKANQHTDEYYNGSYMMAIIYWYRNNLPLASKFFEQAIREVSPDHSRDLASIYTDYANMLTDYDPDKAYELVNKAIEASGNDSYRMTYALTMKGIIAFSRRDGATAIDCYHRYMDFKKSHRPEEVCDMYEEHLKLVAMASEGRHEEAMKETEHQLDNSDRYAIQLAICDYTNDKATAYDILKKLTREEEVQNNQIMEDDLNEMTSDLQVVEAKRDMERWWMIFLIVLVALLFVIIACLVILFVNRRQSLRKLRKAYDMLEETTTQKERIESELRIARDIQMSMVPHTFPERGSLDLYAYMSPAREVGGDLYDYLLYDDKLYFCVGDVSGKGVPASLFMAQTMRLFRMLSAQHMMPAEICTRINRALSGDDNVQAMFVTMFVGLVDLTTGHLDFCNAGHNPPVLGGGQDKGAFLKMEANAPIGICPDLEFVGEQIASVAGRALFVYTDGLNEAENPQNEQFGDERLLSLLQGAADKRSREVIETLTAEVEAHREGADPNDDLTMLCLRLN